MYGISATFYTKLNWPSLWSCNYFFMFQLSLKNLAIISFDKWFGEFEKIYGICRKHAKLSIEDKNLMSPLPPYNDNLNISYFMYVFVHRLPNIKLKIENVKHNNFLSYSILSLNILILGNISQQQRILKQDIYLEI